MLNHILFALKSTRSNIPFFYRYCLSNILFSGKGKCNSFNGEFKNYNDVGETSASLVATKIACDDFEQFYFNCFNATTHFRWENQNLILFNYEDGKEFNYLVFKMIN